MQAVVVAEHDRIVAVEVAQFDEYEAAKTA